MEKITYKKIDYLLILVLVLLAANPFVAVNQILFLIVLFLILVIKQATTNLVSFSVTKNSVLIILFVFSYELTESFIFNNFHILNLLRITAMMYISYLVIKSVNIKTIKIYINIVFYLSLLSLILYPLMYTSLGFSLMQIADKTFALPFSEIGYRAPTFIFYTFDYSFFTEASGVYRNAGFAWEAGAFVIYVNLALIFNLFLNINNENIKVFSFKNLILILALITTFSTTGYIVFFITIIVFIWNSKSLSIYKYIVLGVFLFLSLTLYKSTEFLESKINSQIGEASISQNRFGAALLDLQDFSKRPFFGWSRDTQLLFSNDDLYAAHRPNGITNLLRSYGAIYFIVFFTLMFLSFKKLGNLSTMANKNAFAIFLIATILISAFSQLIFDNIFFRSTLFWGECIISINLIKRIEKTDKNLITE